MLGLLGCAEPKPTLVGRLSGPADVAAFRGCPQALPGCDRTTQFDHLVLVVNARSDEVKIFDAERREFFKAPDPLFPLSLTTGAYPRSIAVEPCEGFAFVANQLGQSVSVLDLASDRLINLADVSLDGHAPQDVVTAPVPGGLLAPAEDCFNLAGTVPVFLSFLREGVVAKLTFRYPGPDRAAELSALAPASLLAPPVTPGQSFQPVNLVYVPEKDLLLVADADLATKTIKVFDAKNWVFLKEIDVGGPSLRLGLAPDRKTLYVIRLDGPRIVLVDLEQLVAVPPGPISEPRATDLTSDGLSIQLDGIPLDVVFVEGASWTFKDSRVVYTSDFDPSVLVGSEEATTSDKVIRKLAYVSTMDGKFFLLDAASHHAIDAAPWDGPSAGQPQYFADPTKEAIDAGQLRACQCQDRCDYPMLTGFDKPRLCAIDLQPQQRSCPGSIAETTLCSDSSKPIYTYGITVSDTLVKNETWTVTYENLMDLSEEPLGRFVGWTFVDTDANFDAAWLLPGDLVEIAPSDEEQPCKNAANEISLAYTIKAIVDAHTLTLDQDLEAVAGIISLEDCWNHGVFHYKLKAPGQWLVRGTLSGRMPRLTPTAPEDPFNTLPPLTPAYTNEHFKLTLSAPLRPGEAVLSGATWRFNTLTNFKNSSFTPTYPYEVFAAIQSMVVVDMGENEKKETRYRIFAVSESANALLELFAGISEASSFYYHK